MGSGHFLVGLVDYLADRVISVMAEAEALVDGYASPLTRRSTMSVRPLSTRQGRRLDRGAR